LCQFDTGYILSRAGPCGPVRPREIFLKFMNNYNLNNLSPPFLGEILYPGIEKAYVNLDEPKTLTQIKADPEDNLPVMLFI